VDGREPAGAYVSLAKKTTVSLLPSGNRAVLSYEHVRTVGRQVHKKL
jgi:hypothetical protein